MSEVVRCVDCHSVFEDKYLLCPECVKERSRQAVLAQQELYRTEIVEERIPLQLGIMAGEHHIQFPVSDQRHGLCGVELHFTKRFPYTYSKLQTVETLCDDCRLQLQKIVRAA